MSLVFDASSIFEAMLRGEVKVLGGNYTVDLARYEIGNVLWKRRVLLGDLSEEGCVRLMDLVKRVLGLMKVVSVECREREVLRLASELGITFYDASYVHASHTMNLPLVTEDDVLKEKVEGLVEVLSVSDVVEARGPRRPS
ncbi:MAG: toxin VapC [Thermoprotei archaeon]|nr:MAG: toxin VapC [Thermoprotei archaeon]